MDQSESVVEVDEFDEFQKTATNLGPDSEVSYWLGSGYPCMNLVIKGDASYLCFFSGQDHICYISQNGQKVEGTILIHEEEQMEVPLDTIISTSEAIEAARKFFQSKNLPKCVQWLEL